MGWGKRLGIAALVLTLGAAAPIVHNETACIETRIASSAPYQPLLPAESRRNLVDTFLTYPEWSIVHAYEDLAAVTRARGEEHFGYWQAVKGYWSSLCSLSRVASRQGDISLNIKAMLYIIGVSFSGEMAVKGLYELTIGRLTAWWRGPERTPDDNFAIKVAEDYARFLNQTPWYQYPFLSTVRAYWSHREPGVASLIRTVERRVALTLEWGVKAVYARAMGALAGAAPAKLTIQSVVSGLSPEWLATISGVSIKREIAEGVVIETPRYRAFTEILQAIAARNGTIREIAGNDRILVTVIGRDGPRDLGRFEAATMFTVPVQARPGMVRHGLELPVGQLAGFMQGASAMGLTFEHAYDY
jgi:hypothetical protein